MGCIQIAGFANDRFVRVAQRVEGVLRCMEGRIDFRDKNDEVRIELDGEQDHDASDHHFTLVRKMGKGVTNVSPFKDSRRRKPLARPTLTCRICERSSDMDEKLKSKLYHLRVEIQTAEDQIKAIEEEYGGTVKIAVKQTEPFRRRRNQLLIDLEQFLTDNAGEIDAEVVAVIGRALGKAQGGTPHDAVADLQELVERKGWGDQLVGRIDDAARIGANIAKILLVAVAAAA
jgi:hypothetical protein